MHRSALGVILAFLALLGAALPALAQQTALTLAQACELTRASSETIRLRELALQKSRLAVGEAGSAILPHLDFQASVAYLTNPPPGYTVSKGQLGSMTIPGLGSVIIPPSDITIGAALHNYFSAAATLSQPLFTWGKIRNAIDLAALQVDVAGNDLVAQQRDIDRQVHASYFAALLAQESEVVLSRIRDTAAEVVADRRKALEHGTINRETVLEAEANLASLEARRIEAGQSRATALESLCLLTGREPGSISLATDFPSTIPSLDEEAIAAKARTSSTDLAAARAQIAQAQKKLSIEKSGAIFRPDVSLGVSLGATGQEDLPFSPWTFSNTTWNWDLMISLGVKMSVFDGLSSANSIGQAEKTVEMAGTGLSQQEKMVRLAVRKAVDAALKAEADVKEKQARAAWAEERLRNARAGYDNGAVSREDLLGADILSGTAALDLLLARYTREEACADIARLTGDRR
jgi:outer membrane protein TolC